MKFWLLKVFSFRLKLSACNWQYRMNSAHNVRDRSKWTLKFCLHMPDGYFLVKKEFFLQKIVIYNQTKNWIEGNDEMSKILEKLSLTVLQIFSTLLVCDNVAEKKSKWSQKSFHVVRRKCLDNFGNANKEAYCECKSKF